MARIDVVEPGDADGRLREIYEEIARSRGKIAEVHKIQSLDPGAAEGADPTMVLRAQGPSDRAILDATRVVSYFNFVNRMVLGLGVELETDPGGYQYE